MLLRSASLGPLGRLSSSSSGSHQAAVSSSGSSRPPARALQVQCAAQHRPQQDGAGIYAKLVPGLASIGVSQGGASGEMKG